MCFSYFLSNLNIQVYFSIFFRCGWVVLILFIFNFCFGLLPIGQSYLCYLLCQKVYLSLLGGCLT